MTEQDELLAAELAFNLIEGDERQLAEQRRASDDPFAEAVARWQSYAAMLLDGREEAPRPSLWPLIEARLPANDTASMPSQSRARGWKIGTLASSTVAVLLAFVAVQQHSAPIPPAGAIAPAPPLIAMLVGTDSKAVVSVSFDPAQRRLTLATQSLKPGRHSAELWVIPADKTPRSLGIIDPSGNWRQAPAGPRSNDDGRRHARRVDRACRRIADRAADRAGGP